MKLQNEQKGIMAQDLANQQARHYRANKKMAMNYTGGLNGGEKMVIQTLSKANTGSS